MSKRSRNEFEQELQDGEGTQQDSVEEVEQQGQDSQIQDDNRPITRSMGRERQHQQDDGS